MKVLRNLYGFVFKRNEPKKKRKISYPSERPKYCYNKYLELGLFEDVVLKQSFTKEWIKDKNKWKNYFRHNKNKILVNIGIHSKSNNI